jgi:hypothetical protein
MIAVEGNEIDLQLNQGATWNNLEALVKQTSLHPCW